MRISVDIATHIEVIRSAAISNRQRVRCASPMTWQRAFFWAEGKIERERERKKKEQKNRIRPPQKKLADSWVAATSLLFFPCFSGMVESYFQLFSRYFALDPKTGSLPGRRGRKVRFGITNDFRGRIRKRHINIWHINNFSVTPVTDPPGRVPDPPGRVPRRKCLCSLGSAHST